MIFSTRYLNLQISFLLSLFISTLNFAQLDESWKLYDDSQVARVDITVDSAVIEWLYQNPESDSEFVANFHFQNAYINETVDSIGFRLRGNTSRNAQKKSFKVSFNTFIAGREFYGVDKLNLNGEHNDPSIIRSKLCFDHFKTIGVKASRANHVEVYINGQYYGLYISVEHIDDEFLRKNFADNTGNLWKCLYPADLNYLGSDPNLYKAVNSNGRPAYELMTNESGDDFSKLARFISVLNNSLAFNLPDSLESIIDVPGVLKYFAMNVLFGEWDDYWSLMNNYYLYHHPIEDKFYLIPYDYDNTYGIDWFNINWTNANPYNFPKVSNGYRPLAERLMANAQYRNLYTHFLEFYRQNVYLLGNWNNSIDQIKTLITQSAVNDTFRTLDYGFTVDDFHNSYSENSYTNQHVKYGLKQFVNLRNATLPGQLSYQSASPIVYKIDYYPKNPSAADSIYVYVSAFDNNGLSDVTINYLEDGTTASVNYPMTYSPIAGSKLIEDADRWVGVIPPLGAGKTGKLFINVIDNQNQSQTYPRKQGIEIKTPQVISNAVVINEFMADNAATITDSAGEYDDWIELFNPTSNMIPLTGKYLTDKKDNLTKWRFIEPNIFLAPNEYLIVWCDEDSGQVGHHTNFKLSASGEFIALVDNDGVSIIDSITFGPQITDISFGRLPNGTGNWQFLSPTPGGSNLLVSVEKNIIIPTEFTLNAYPNPFNPSTAISFYLPTNSEVKLTIFDILGNEIITLMNEEKMAGLHKVIWEGKNSEGSKVSTGVYIVRLNADNQFKNLKLMLLK